MRPTWNESFMEIAFTVAKRATCDRKHVGCVLVVDRRIVASGYNGSLAGEAHCDDVGHDMVDGGCVRTVHAEANAVADAARRGVSLESATAYCTTFPCWVCFKLLAQAGIARIIFAEVYRKNDPGADRILQAAERLCIKVRAFKEASDG